jgi:hypothetical protein
MAKFVIRQDGSPAQDFTSLDRIKDVKCLWPGDTDFEEFLGIGIGKDIDNPGCVIAGH